MKKVGLFLIFITISFCARSQNVDIPDANLKIFLLSLPAINTDGNSEISVAEAEAYDGSLNCSGINIQSMKGIEAFIKLDILWCSDNQLSELDVSNNTVLIGLFCRNNQLSELDVSNNIALTHLNCTNNQLSVLDVSNNIALRRLDCDKNQLCDLDISNNIDLRIFYCESNNLSSLNVANNNNPNFTRFDATDNPDLSCIQIDDGFTPPNFWEKDATASYGISCCFSETCLEVVNVSNIQCDDQGTADSSDDTWSFDLIVNNSTAGSWYAGSPVNESGNYNEVKTIEMGNISDYTTSTISFSISDSENFECSTTIELNIPESCSDSCTLEVLTSVDMCSDNGTPGDPTDDYYNITLDVFNTDQQPWTVVDSNGLTIYFGNGDENNVDLGNYLVLNGSEGFQIRYDADCILDFGVVAPTSCNFSCNISAIVSTGDCNDNGTPEDLSDDYYTIIVSVLGTNGVSWDLIGYVGNQPISYSGTGNTTNFELGPINANDVSWVMYISPTDLSDPGCRRYETTIFAPKCDDENRPKAKEKVFIVPNPNMGKMNINVETSTDVQNVSLKIHNLSGLLVDTIEGLKVENGILGHDLDLSSQLRQGIYFFIFNIGDKTITKQVIVKY